jgi:hypothetical protein
VFNLRELALGETEVISYFLLKQIPTQLSDPEPDRCEVYSGARHSIKERLTKRILLSNIIKSNIRGLLH